MGFKGWELEGCNPPLRFLFVEWPLMALWDEIGLCFFFGTALVNLRNSFSGSGKKNTFPLKLEMEWTLLAGIAGVKPGTAKKTICRDLKNYFFGTALVKLIDARLCKKKIRLYFVFFACPLLNLPTPPRYPRLSSSKLRRCIQYITKSALRIWGTLDLLWWKFACIKNKEYEGPWASSFRINQLSGCIYWSYVHQLSYHQNQLINPLNLHMFLGISSPFSHGFPASPRAKLGASPSVPSPRHWRPVVRIISTFQPQLVTVVDQRTPGPCELKNLRKLSGLEIRVVFFIWQAKRRMIGDESLSTKTNDFHGIWPNKCGLKGFNQPKIGFNGI